MTPRPANLDPTPSFVKQMWACTGCGFVRQWGYGAPEDRQLQPLLVCEGVCKDEFGRSKSTRHQSAQ